MYWESIWTRTLRWGRSDTRLRASALLPEDRFRLIERIRENTMAKPLEKPEEIKVTVNIEGVPLSFLRNDKRHRVTAIYHRWLRVDEWGTETEKEYFKVKAGGLFYDIYHELANNRWYISKIRD